MTLSWLYLPHRECVMSDAHKHIRVIITRYRLQSFLSSMCVLFEVVLFAAFKPVTILQDIGLAT